MLLKEICLYNFRNYHFLKFTPKQEVNFFFGCNGEGKTNLIEAIFYLFSSYSYRCRRDIDLINWNRKFFKITGQVSLTAENKKINPSVTFAPPNKKQLTINGYNVGKQMYYTGFPVVLFNPDDVDLIKGSPVGRRRFLDMEISRVFPRYYLDLLHYNRILRQRNALLKSSVNNRKNNQELYSYSNMLCSYGSKIILKRLVFLKKLQEYTSNYQKEFTAGKEKVTLFYRSKMRLKLADMDCTHEAKNEEAIFDAFQNLIKERKHEEIQKKFTTVGPHVEDFGILINHKDSRTFSSQGQQRTTALALKMSIMDMLIEERDEVPVLLLDDVFSELDRRRRDSLLKVIGERKVQCFITGNDNEFTHAGNPDKLTAYKIREGAVEYA